VEDRRADSADALIRPLQAGGVWPAPPPTGDALRFLAGSPLSPRFDGREEGPEVQARQIAELWGLNTSEYEPLETPAPRAPSSSRLPSSSTAPPPTHRSPQSATPPEGLEEGLNLLPADLNAEVRRLLALDAPSPPRNARGEENGAPLPTSVPMRLLAADLSLFLASDGSDTDTRRHLLARVQHLREEIARSKLAAQSYR
jgi:hypothetical protein